MSVCNYPKLTLPFLWNLWCCRSSQTKFVHFDEEKNSFVCSQEMPSKEQARKIWKIFENTMLARFHGKPEVLSVINELFDDQAPREPLAPKDFHFFIDSVYSGISSPQESKSEMVSKTVHKLYMLSSSTTSKQEISKELLIDMLSSKMPTVNRVELAKMARAIKSSIREIHSIGGPAEISEKIVKQKVLEWLTKNADYKPSPTNEANLKNTILVDSKAIYIQSEEGSLRELSDELIAAWVREIAQVNRHLEIENIIEKLRIDLQMTLNESLQRGEPKFCFSDKEVRREIQNTIEAFHSASSVDKKKTRVSDERELSSFPSMEDWKGKSPLANSSSIVSNRNSIVERRSSVPIFSNPPENSLVVPEKHGDPVNNPKPTGQRRFSAPVNSASPSSHRNSTQRLRLRFAERLASIKNSFGDPRGEIDSNSIEKSISGDQTTIDGDDILAKVPSEARLNPTRGESSGGSFAGASLI